MYKITLGQLLQYFDDEQTPAERIQIVTGDHDWDEADELFVDSELITPFIDWTVESMFFEKSFYDGKPLIRVAIEE